MIVLNPLTTVAGTKELYSTRLSISSGGGYDALPSSCFPANGLKLPVFANPASSSDRENDKFNFSFTVNSGYYVIATLVKGSDSYTINDQTYGDYEPFTISTSLRTWGFILDFKKVATALGYGDYKLVIDIRLVANDSIVRTVESPCFHLMKYECQLADKTVKIFVEQDGYLRNGIDWQGLAGTAFDKYEVRTYGRLKRTGFTTETESLIDDEDRSQQISTGIFDNYTLSLNWIDFLISEVILKEYMMANKVLISDFNLDSPTVYNRVPLKYLTADEPSKFKGLKQEFFNINLEDFQKNNIKRY